MERILAFLSDEQLRHRLTELCRNVDDLEVTVVDGDDALFSQMETESYQVLVVDRAIEALSEERIEEIVQRAQQGFDMAAFGDAAGEALEESTRLDGVEELVGWLDIESAPRRVSNAVDDRPDSGKYLVGDTQDGHLERRPGSSHVSAPRGLAHHTSEIDRARRTPARLLYVGPRDSLRRGIEQLGEKHGVAVAAVDSPEQVGLSNAAIALDLVVFATDEKLAETRRAIRLLRHRQAEIAVDIVLLCGPKSDITEGLARSLGGDGIWRRPVEPSELLERVEPVTGRGESLDILIVSGELSRRGLFEAALAREPVDLVFTYDLDRAVETFRRWEPDIILFDRAASMEDGRSLLRRFRELAPFGLTHFLRVVGQDDEVTPRMRECFDDLLYEPLERTDVRRVVRRQIAQIKYGRHRFDRDALTGVHTTLLLVEQLQEVLDEAQDDGDSVVLTGIDVDGLARINEHYGRAVGDSVLRSLADSLRVAVGSREVIYRTPEDEFFVLCRTGSKEWPELRDRLDRALRVFQQQTFRAPDGRGTYATATGGTVVIPPVSVPAEVCLQKCWVVLERAMKAGRDELLVAHLDPSAFSEREPARDRIDERE